MANLITASEVISKAFTNSNTDTSLIKDSFIEIAQYNHLRPVIGEDLYNKIISEKATGEEDSDTAGLWKSTASVACVNQSVNLTGGSVLVDAAVGYYVEGNSIPLFKEGYTTDENNHYTKLVVKTNNSSGAMNAKYQGLSGTINLTFWSPIGYLVEKHIKDFLAFAVKFEVLPDMTYNSTSQGIVENVADFTTPVNSKKLSFLRNEIYKQAQSYKRRMVEFIENEENNYPLYIKDDESTTKRSGIIMY